MISSAMNRSVAVFVLALVCSLVQGGEPTQIPIQLEFEISPTPLGPYIASGMGSEWQPFASYRPSYAVAIPLVSPIDWLPSPARHTMDNFVGNAKWGGYAEEARLSEQQKAFVRATKTLLNNPRTSLLMDRPDPNGPQRVFLYTLSLADAKDMAQAYYQFARNDWWWGYFDSRSKKVRESAEKVAREQKRLAEVEQQIETAQKSLEGPQKTVPYRTESEAHEAIGELDRMLNAAQVESAGIKAKMQAIMKHQRDSQRLGQEIINRLEMMYVEEAIVLQGTEARRQMATQLREQANRFIDSKSALTSALGEKKSLEERLAADQKALADLQPEVEATRQQEPKIPNKVIIYPVKWANESRGN